MREHFIKRIEIKNFKCFEDFKAEGFGRVNLIGGKNNVGKTAFMEACSINVYSQDIESMTMALRNPRYRREKINLLKKEYINNDTKKFIELCDKYESKSNIRSIKFEIITDNGIKEYNYSINNEKKSINIRDFSYELKHFDNIIFIDSYGFRDKDINEIYSFVQIKDKEEELNKFINSFDNNLERFKIFTEEPPKPKCKPKNSNKYRDLNEFGDGLKHYISIICSLYACENGYLFIDEIDNGIHYSHLDKLWEIILTISKQQNVQVFATTHSKECIESYARVAKKLEDEEITFFELGRNDKNEIDSILYPYQWLIDEIEKNHEVRGW
jgi:AAA15 family ATPase/GTPase